MSNIGYATVSVIPSAKGFGKDLGRQLDGQMTQTGKSSGGKLSGALGGVLKKSVLGVGIAAGGVLGAALFKGFNRLTAIEDARAKLDGLGHSAKTVDKVMNNALNSVKGTAFGLDEAGTIAAGAVAAGIKPGKDLEKTLGLVGDAATIGGTTLGEMGAIFNKVATSNKIQGDVIAQLNDTGIPIVQMLGKTLGKTSEEVTDMASNGQIDFATFSKAMQGGLGGAALKSGDTTIGAFKNMQAALGRFGASLLKGVFPLAKVALGGLTKAFDNFGTKAAPAIERFSAKLAAAIPKVVTFAKSLVPALKAIVSVITDKIIPAVGRFVEGFENGTGAGGKLKDALSIVSDIVTGVVIPAFKRVAKAVESVVKFFKKHQTAAEVLGVAVGAVVALVTAAWIAQSIVAAIEAAKSVIAWMVVATTSTTSASIQKKSTAQIVVGWIVAGVKATAGAVVQVAAWLLTKIAAAGTIIAYGIAFAFMAAGWIASGIVATASAVVMAAAWLIALGPIAIVIALVVAVVVAIILNWDKVKSATVRVWNALKNAVVRAVRAVVNFVKSHWKLLLAIITGPIGLAVLLVVKYWSKIKSATSTAFNFVKNIIKTVLTAVKTTVTTGVSNVVAVFKGLPGKIRDVFAGAGSWLVDAGARILTGLISGITSKIGAVQSKLGELTGMIPDWKGPAALDRVLLKPSGQMIIGGLISGFESQFGAAKTSLGGLTGSLVDSVQPPRGANFDASTSNSGSAGFGSTGPIAFTITNWDTGEGYIRNLAADEVQDHAALTGTIGRQY